MVIGIDLTSSTIDSSAICKGVMEYVTKNGDDGTIIIAVAITARTLTQPIILAEEVLPSYPGIKKKDRKRAIESFSQKLVWGLKKRNTYPKDFFRQSRIDEFFDMAGNIFEEQQVPIKHRQMMLLSDMLQVDEQRNWESGQKINTNQMRIYEVGGTIAIYNVQSASYVNAAKWKMVHEAWTNLLKQAGVSISTYTSQYPR